VLASIFSVHSFGGLLIQRQSFLLYTVLFIASSFAVAQNASGTAPSPSQSPHVSAAAPSTAVAGPVSVAPNATVITIEGICDLSLTGSVKAPARGATAAKASTTAKTSTTSSTAKGADGDCKTQVTRAEFENLLKAVAPAAPPAVHRQIASRYVQLLTAADEGIKLGVNKDPEFDEQLAISKLQLLAQMAERKLQTQATNVSESEEKSYYDQNPSAFEEVTLTRIFVPRENASAAGGAQPAVDAKAIADSARQQLASGEDADKVQKSVYEQLKNTTAPPATKFGSKRRGAMAPAQEQQIFSLKPGEVSEVMPDSIGYVIYRVDSKQQLPFDQAKDDIKRRIAQQHVEDARQKILNASKADYNEAYFGPESASSRVGPAGGAPPAARPPASSAPTESNQTPPSTNPK
jgi:parvulin-like peptidyl-prolyl cis-trans isomerase-like protein